MKKYFMKLFFIPLIFVGLISCENSKLTEPVSTLLEGMIPLKVGFKWTSKISQFNANGILTNTLLYSTEVAKDTMIENERWFILKEDDYAQGNLYTNRNNVTYFYNNGNPLITFNTVIEDTAIKTHNGNGSYLISKNNIIQVPYGNFACNQYQVYYNFLGKKLVAQNYYVALNKGILKSESFSFKNNGESYISVVAELVSTNVF